MTSLNQPANFWLILEFLGPCVGRFDSTDGSDVFEMGKKQCRGQSETREPMSVRSIATGEFRTFVPHSPLGHAGENVLFSAGKTLLNRSNLRCRSRDVIPSQVP